MRRVGPVMSTCLRPSLPQSVAAISCCTRTILYCQILHGRSWDWKTGDGIILFIHTVIRAALKIHNKPTEQPPPTNPAAASLSPAGLMTMYICHRSRTAIVEYSHKRFCASVGIISPHLELYRLPASLHDLAPLADLHNRQWQEIEHCHLHRTPMKAEIAAISAKNMPCSSSRSIARLMVKK